MGSPWTFGPRAILVTWLQTSLYVTVVYHPQQGWGSYVFQIVLAHFSSPHTHPRGILLSSSSDNSVEFHLDEGDLSSNLQDLILLFRAWAIGVNFGVTLIEVLWFLSYGLCLWWVLFHFHLTKPNSQKCLPPKWIHVKMSLGFTKRFAIGFF